MTVNSNTKSAPADGRTTPFNDEELDFFRNIILKKRRAAHDDLQRMQFQIQESRENATSDSAYSHHMADAGTDAMEREKLYLMIARQQKFINYLDRALERIENKSYGLCKVTGKPIAKGRLIAVPHTELSVEAKQKQSR